MLIVVSKRHVVILYVSFQPVGRQWTIRIGNRILSIENTLRSNRASEYTDKLAESIAVEDKKGNLNYLKVYAKREENAQAEGENSQGENSQGENTPEDTASPEGSGE